MDELSILGALKEYADSGLLPMHMPGHKRNARMLAGELPWAVDVTEVGPFDALHAPEGLLQVAMGRAAEHYGSKATFFLVNGSSGGILAAVRAMVGRSGRAVVAQNSHRSVYHALELCGIMPEYVAPAMDGAFGVAGGISPADVESALCRAPDAKLVIITSPTYEGILSDIRAIADIAHSRGAALLVDEAHGAHLPFSDLFPASAMSLGADAVVQSLHKTLPSLTQTAVLHVMTDRVDSDNMRRQLSIFETSSPSFVLLASIDECVRLMARDGSALLGEHHNKLASFSGSVAGLRHLRVRGHGADAGRRIPEATALDPAKLLISTAGTAMDGAALSGRLLSAYGIELEMSMGDAALAMSTVCDPPGALMQLAEALIGIDAQLAKAGPKEPMPAPPAMVQRVPIGDALAMPGECVPLSRAQGRMSLEYVWAYPPGVPLLVPGAVVSADAAAMLEGLLRGGARLHSTRGGLAAGLHVC